MPDALAVGLVIGASLASGFGTAIGSASSNLARLQKKSESIKLGASLGRNFQDLRDETMKVRKEYEATGYKSAELGSRLLTLQRETAAARESAVKYGISIKDVAKQTQALAVVSERTEVRIGRAQERMARRQARGTMKMDLLGAAALAAAVFKYPLTAASNFEAEMNRVGAITKANAEQMTALRNNAREMGRDTQFTATQAASAQEYLGMAGYKTNEIIAVMPGNLALAAAGNLDLARTADISSNILSGFALKAGEANRVADVMAETATSSNTNIEQMGDAMKYAAPIAKNLGITLEQTAAMVGLMGNAGIQGSMAGTSLREAFIRLAKPPLEAKKAIKDLHVTFKDANGNMRPMPKVLREIAMATRGMGDAQRTATIAAIFGQEAASGMSTVLDGALDGSLDKFITKLNGCNGAATTMAKRMNEGARGSLIRLGSAAESVAIDFGNVLIPPLTSAIEKAAVMTAKVSDLAQKHPMLTKVIVGTAAGLVSLNLANTAGRLGWSYMANGASVLLDGLNMLRPSTIQATITLMKMKGAGSIVGGVFATMKGSVFGFGKTVFSELKIAALGVRTLGTAILTTPVGWFLLAAVAIGAAAYMIWKHWDFVKAKLLVFWNGVKKAWSGIGAALSSFFSPFFKWIGDKVDWIVGKWQAFKNFLSSGPEAGTAPKGKGSNAGAPAPVIGHATGGIFDKPHVAAFAEQGKAEAVIPLEGNRERARSIFEETGRRLGTKQQYARTSNASIIKADINIYGSGSTDPAAIAREVKRVITELEREARARERGNFADAPVFG